MVKLGKVTVIYTGTGFPKELQGCKEGKYPFYKVGDISKNVLAGYKKLMLCDNYIEEDAVKKIKGKILPKDTVVFAKIGEAVKLNRRAITTKECLVDNNVMGIAPVKSFMDINYLYYYMSFVKLENLAEATTVPSVKKGMIEDLEIDLPTLDTQRIISNIISEVDDLILLINKQLDDLNVIVKSRFIEMFGENKSKNHFGKLSDVCLDIIAGGDRPNEISYEQTEEYCYPVFANARTNNGLLYYAKSYKIASKAVTIAARGATVGFTAIRDSYFTPIVRLITLIPNKSMNVYYMKYYIDYNLKIVSSGSAQPQLTVPYIKNLKILIPTSDMQNQFASFVMQVDKSEFVEVKYR